MVVFEEGSNFPAALGKKNLPWTMARSGSIGEQAMALARGETPVHLAQKVRGRKVRPSNLSVVSEFETEVHNAQFRNQLTKYPILPLLDRPHPMVDAVKAWAPVIPRTKLLGVFGIVDPTEPGVSIDGYEKNIPRPYPRPMEWAPGKLIQTIPSVVAAGAGATGPSRTVHPSTISIEL